MTKKFTLGKIERLKSRKQIEQLFKEGKNFAVFPFRVYYRQSAMGKAQWTTQDSNPQTQKPKLNTQNSVTALQFGVGVSGKNFSKAVDRNQIKRLTREAYRLQKSELQEKLLKMNNGLFLFFIYTAKDLADFRLIWEKTRVILKKLCKLADENKLN
jgi:ribonuclease P protein component